MNPTKNDVVRDAEAQFSDMFAQSISCLSQPSVATFERYEKHGGVTQALMYVALAALISGVVAGFFSIFHSDVGLLQQFFGRIVSTVFQFFAFTGLVYGIGKYLFKGTGTYPEVAYTFALFFAPITIIVALIGWIPLFNFIMPIIAFFALVYFGFLAIQSSMNIRDQTNALIALVLSGVAYMIIGVIFASIF